MKMYEEISTQEVNERLKKGEKLNIVDVREDEEVAAGRIPGAQHLPLSHLPNRVAELDKETDYILVCRSGNRSGRASEWLAENGYKVKSMAGGMLEWPGEVEK
ncbi:rhodanese-like domain-containing protein [Aneurinibacillus tyrosinisolvens]|jgi:rhodanese-related sulfurtransferase|uniref:rhodanese-like domain-containing protein n=1 Tax=Aneurinibacillus tyrosinisolvens TaxID=1443435 RepID=UPI00063F96CB|nr:rhodanese-like domain-containing protein [Aneurinibacillus tyrosinisolvens]